MKKKCESNTVSPLSRIVTTIRGALVGAVISLLGWALLFLVSTIDDGPGWKFRLFFCGVLFPLICVPIGVMASQRNQEPRE